MRAKTIALEAGYESLSRFFNPVPIAFNQAIPIAVVGLGVNCLVRFYCAKTTTTITHVHTIVLTTTLAGLWLLARRIQGKPFAHNNPYALVFAEHP